VKLKVSWVPHTPVGTKKGIIIIIIKQLLSCPIKHYAINKYGGVVV
jgi:hypothetical protein